MLHLLGRPGRAALDALLHRRTLLAFDYDGTLAPLRRHSIDAWLTPPMQRKLALLCRAFPCAVVSGRGLADLRLRMQGIGPCTLVGNHGMERDFGGTNSTRWSLVTRQWTRRLRRGLATFEGVSVEPKRYSLSIHWRGAPNGAGMTRRVWAIASQLEGARLIGGKQVLNVIPADAPNKGDAVLEAMRLHRCRQALFAGDDVTDEDGFALGKRRGFLGVRVGRNKNTLATYFLRSQAEVAALLDVCLSHTSAGSHTLIR